MMKGRTVNMEIKRALHDSIIMPTLMYASDTWTWNETEISRIQASRQGRGVVEEALVV